MFPSNKTALYDKESPVALLPVRVAYKLCTDFYQAGYTLFDYQTPQKANKTDPDVCLVGVGVENTFFYQ